MTHSAGRGGLYAPVLLAVIALLFSSCLPPHGFWHISNNESTVVVPGPEGDGDIWKGEAVSEAEAATAWGAPQKGWLYRNTAENNIYRYDGEKWVKVAGGPSVRSSIKISGSYIPQSGGYFPVRVYFTDGGVADGYVDDVNGEVRLYDDHWNDQGGAGKTYHTLKILTSNENILLSRAYDMSDPVLLNIGADGKLQFRAAAANNPNDPGVPYIPISTVGELALIDRDMETLRGAYRLTRDLDLLGSPVSVSGNVLAPRPHNWEPIGDSAVWFTGTFDGDGRRLANLYIDRSQDDWVGLFSFFSGTVKNTLVSGSVAGNIDVGGIAAINGGRIEGCSFDGQVAGNATVGGVAGRVGTGGRIEGCSFDGQVTGSQIVGGVAGVVDTGGRIEGCSNTGTVTANIGYGGGVTGWNNGAIIACSNKGAVTTVQRAGGVVDENNGTITACYNTGTVTTASEAGGVAAYNNGTITACYNVGPVYDPAGWGGWVVSNNQGTIQACFWIPGGDASLPICDNSGTASSQQFSAGGWPRGDSDSEPLWQINNADGSGPGHYWKSMGTSSDSPGPDDFPCLWWE
ncbi:MAG: hypothetical protein LBC88_00325 [Spirochaetaceae bacterium]|nr:hypothetical protein [Spirochaetaceae bacterium]